MNAKFDDAFTEWLSKKKYLTIPQAKTYENILNVLLNYANANASKVKLTKTEKNWVTRSKIFILNKYLTISCFLFFKILH